MVLSVVPRMVNPPPLAVASVGPPLEKVAPVADPEPWKVWSMVTVVPLTAVTVAGAGCVTPPPPPVRLTTTPGARLVVSLTLVISFDEAAIFPVNVPAATLPRMMLRSLVSTLTVAIVVVVPLTVRLPPTEKSESTPERLSTYVLTAF